jgi:hypothetical protein
MTKCANCFGKLGLGVRFLSVWNRETWRFKHVRFCSARCEATYENDIRDEKARRKFLAYLSQPP